MKREAFDKIVNAPGVQRGPIKRTARYVPAIPALYRAGCSVEQIRQLFGVSKKFVRMHLKAAKVKMRDSGTGKTAPRPSGARILAILKEHHLTLDDLPEPPANDAKSTRGGTT